MLNFISVSFWTAYIISTFRVTVSFRVWVELGVRTLRTQDSSALVPKCPTTLRPRYKMSRHFGTSAEVSDGHFGPFIKCRDSSALVPTAKVSQRQFGTMEAPCTTQVMQDKVLSVHSLIRHWEYVLPERCCPKEVMYSLSFTFLFVCLFIPQLHSDLLTNAVCSGITQLPILPIQDIRAVVEVHVCRG